MNTPAFRTRTDFEVLVDLLIDKAVKGATFTESESRPACTFEIACAWSVDGWGPLRPTHNEKV